MITTAESHPAWRFIIAVCFAKSGKTHTAEYQKRNFDFILHGKNKNKTTCNNDTAKGTAVKLSFTNNSSTFYHCVNRYVL